MARSIYCPYCGDKNKASSAKYEEKYRAVEGPLLYEAVCDSCSKYLAPGDTVIAFTTHPQGPEIVMPWEHEYLKVEAPALGDNEA